MSKGIIDIDEAFKHACEPFEDGYLFYPWRWSKGYKISEEELESLKGWSRPINNWTFLITFSLAIPVILGLSLYLEISLAWDSALSWAMVAVGLILSAFLAYGLAPQFAVLGRKPVAPRRSAKKNDEIQARTTPWWLLIVLPVVLLLQFVTNGKRWLEYAVDHPFIAIPFGAFVMFGLYICARVVREKLRQRGE